MKLKMKYNMYTVQKGDSFLVGQKGRERNSLSDTKDCRWRICKNRNASAKYRRISVYKLTAQQVDDERTTAVVRFTIVYSPTTDTISSNNLSYIFQQLIPVLPAPLPISINTPIHFREQTEAHQYRTAKA